MKKFIYSLPVILTLISSSAMASEIQGDISVFTTSNWSNLKVVNYNNPSVVCYQFGKMRSGSTLYLPAEQLKSDQFKQCNTDNNFGLIFFGNYSGTAYPPKKVHPGQHCTASYSFSKGLVLDCD